MDEAHSFHCTCMLSSIRPTRMNRSIGLLVDVSLCDIEILEKCCIIDGFEIFGVSNPYIPGIRSCFLCRAEQKLKP